MNGVTRVFTQCCLMRSGVGGVLTLSLLRTGLKVSYPEPGKAEFISSLFPPSGMSVPVFLFLLSLMGNQIDTHTKSNSRRKDTPETFCNIICLLTDLQAKYFSLPRDRASLCSPCCTRTRSVDQAGLKLRGPAASASRGLGLRCAPPLTG